MSETTMNLRGLKCPLPALRVRKMLSGLKTGDLIVAECTDPLTAIDIPNLLRQTGDTLEGKAEAKGDSHLPHPQEMISAAAVASANSIQPSACRS